MKMLVIDGSSAEGGGQIPRTALALSMVTGQPFRIKNIRARRRKPGLMRQHVTVIESAMRLCSAGVDGLGLGSSEFTFFPGDVRPGEYTFNAGRAVSISFLLQTILPVLALAKGKSSVTFTGGIANPSAPPLEFLLKSYLPQLRKMGLEASLKLDAPATAQVGISRCLATIEPMVRFRPVSLMDRGVPMQRKAMTSVTSLTGHESGQEVREFDKTLAMASASFKEESRPTNVMLEMSYEGVTEIFTGFARSGVSHEAATTDAAKQARTYMSSNAAVCEFLADQLLVPLALAGSGRLTTTRISPHAKASMDTIRTFLGVEFYTEPLPGGCWLLEVRRA